MSAVDLPASFTNVQLPPYAAECARPPVARMYVLYLTTPFASQPPACRSNVHYKLATQSERKRTRVRTVALPPAHLVVKGVQVADLPTTHTNDLEQRT